MDLTMVAGIGAGLVLLAALVGGEFVAVRGTGGLRMARSWLIVTGVLAVTAVALVLPQLVKLLT